MKPQTGCVCVVVAALQIALQAQRPPASLVIGAVRADGLVFPLASLEGERWTPLTTDDDGVVKLTAAARQLPRDGWHLLPRSGAEAAQLTLGAVRTVDAQCARAEAFASNAPAKGPGDPQSPTPAVAFLGADATGALPERLTPPYDAAAQRVTRIVIPLTHALEAQRADEEPKSFLANQTPVARSAVPVRITKLVRTTLSRSTTYYFEARKRYGEENMAVTGWVRMEVDRTELEQIAGILETKSAHGGGTRDVLGIATLHDRAVWVMHHRGYESWSHELYEFVPFRPIRLAIRASIGGC